MFRSHVCIRFRLLLSVVVWWHASVRLACDVDPWKRDGVLGPLRASLEAGAEITREAGERGLARGCRRCDAGEQSKRDAELGASKTGSRVRPVRQGAVSDLRTPDVSPCGNPRRLYSSASVVTLLSAVVTGKSKSSLGLF